MSNKINVIIAILISFSHFAGTCAQNDSVYNVRRAASGIIVVDSGAHTRAFEPFGCSPAAAEPYAEMVNSYKRAFGEGVSVYCMTIPNAVAYYCPESHKSWTRDEKATLDNLYSHLSDSVIKVEIYDTLASHASEPIYSRTDHHWAPLGAYYAARLFAHVAGVGFQPLSAYEEHVVRNYVGTMYKFSRDIAVKKAPEDFVYYIPQGIEYATQSIDYTRSRNRRGVIESAPAQRDFFVHYSDGSSGAYCCFMGGDTRTVRVVTGTANGRRLLILKDSYGNALPSNLFYGFEQIHVVDYRYFPHNIKSYVEDNGITDVLFANNLIHACSPSTSQKYMKMLQPTTRSAEWR